MFLQDDDVLMLHWTSMNVFFVEVLEDYFQTRTGEDYLTKIDLLFHGKLALKEGAGLAVFYGVEEEDAPQEVEEAGLKGASLEASESVVVNVSLQLMGGPGGHAY